MIDKTAITQVPIDEIILKRWSPRAFEANKPVEQDQIIALVALMLIKCAQRLTCLMRWM